MREPQLRTSLALPSRPTRPVGAQSQGGIRAWVDEDALSLVHDGSRKPPKKCSRLVTGLRERFQSTFSCLTADVSLVCRASAKWSQARCSASPTPIRGPRPAGQRTRRAIILRGQVGDLSSWA